MCVELHDKHPSHSIAKNWVARFRRGHLSTEHEEPSGRPTLATFPQNVTAIRSMILSDGRISAKRIVDILAISREKVGYTSHGILDVRSSHVTASVVQLLDFLAAEPEVPG
jgi:transposase